MENYTTTGKILPIGLLVCSHCKEKQLRGIDFTNSQVIGPTDIPVEPMSSSSSAAAVSVCPVAEKRHPTSGSGKEESNVIIYPVVRQQTQQSVKGTERLHFWILTLWFKEKGRVVTCIMYCFSKNCNNTMYCQIIMGQLVS